MSDPAQIFLFIFGAAVFILASFGIDGYGLGTTILLIESAFFVTMAASYGDPWSWETLFLWVATTAVVILANDRVHRRTKRLLADFYVVTFFLPHLAIWWVNKGLNRVSDGKIPVIGPNPVALANYKPEVYGQAARRHRESM